MNEKNNTFRTLKEETPLIKSIWCYFGIHNWTVWGEPQKGIWKSSISMYKHHVVFQYRCCGNCHKLDRRMYKLGTADNY